MSIWRWLNERAWRDGYAQGQMAARRSPEWHQMRRDIEQMLVDAAMAEGARQERLRA